MGLTEAFHISAFVPHTRKGPENTEHLSRL